jgi:hypothetical protein
MQFYIETELRYPDFIALKSDVFIVHDPADLPQGFLKWQHDNVYNWLNESGYWYSGELEISDEQQKFIDDNNLAGMQDEVVVGIEIKM